MTVYHLMAIALKKIWCESADTKEHIQRHKVSMYSTKKYEREGGIEISGKDFLPRIKKTGLLCLAIKIPRRNEILISFFSDQRTGGGGGNYGYYVENLLKKRQSCNHHRAL